MSQKQKILHLFKSSKLHTDGGIEQAVAALADAQAAFADVTIFSAIPRAALHRAEKKSGTPSGHPNPNYIASATQLEMASTPISIGFILNIIFYARKFDVIYIHYPYPIADLASFLLKRKSKLIVLYHADIVDKAILLKAIYHPLKLFMLNRADSVIASSDNYLRTSETLQKIKHKVSVIPLGIKPIEVGKNLSALDQNIAPRPYFLFLGVFRAYKGVLTLVRAFEKMPFNLVLVGAGGEWDRVDAFIKQRKMKNVFLTGRLGEEQKNQLLKNAYALFLASSNRAEAFGLSLLEAMNFSKPLITTELGTGTSFVNKNGLTGLVMKNNEEETIIATTSFLAHNPALASLLGKNARARYLELFTDEQFTSKHNEHLVSITHSSKPAS